MVHVYSEPGKGATFNIYLPASAKTIEGETPAPADVLRSGSGGVLLVDDEPMILNTASHMLAKLGYTVFQAASGKEALALYREKQSAIDLVILDMIMPGITGSQMLKLLKEMNPEVRIILSSGYSLQGDVQALMEMGCRGFIQKPYNFVELSNIVHQNL